MPKHTVGTRKEWLAARVELLEKEKELTRRNDELARQRLALPWVQIDKEYLFATNDGNKRLADLFDGRSQLLVDHLMFGAEDEAPCPGCSFQADNFAGAVTHLEHHDVSFVAASRAPLEKLNAYKSRQGWGFPWVSSFGSDFDLDFSAFTEEDRRNGTGFNFGTQKHDIDLREQELMAVSAFALEDGIVYHTYSAYDRGTDGLNGTWQLLDRTPKGRSEGASRGWPRRSNENESAGAEA